MLTLLFPISITILGLYIKLNPPKINSIIAVRTKLSMLSKDTFNYANERISNLFIISGFIALILLTICRVIFNTGTESVDYLFYIIHIFCPLIPLYIVNNEIQNNFDKNGRHHNF